MAKEQEKPARQTGELVESPEGEATWKVSLHAEHRFSPILYHYQDEKDARARYDRLVHLFGRDHVSLYAREKPGHGDWGMVG